MVVTVKYCTRVLFVLLRTSFEALASCVALPSTASELIYFVIYFACKSFGLPPDRRNYTCLLVCVSCCFKLPANGRQFSTFVVRRLLLGLDRELRNLSCLFYLGQVF